ncbi:GMC family oxidoreductase N-terminal domain-containing protein [Aquitalea denitrificans]|uniref:GMC family oxidoreductase N-terminal domain-containing protein n=1 Tax=Aquitalea denitrificans TaxID=519081 RepID=UPI001F0E6E86|nr:GMC family oxidoreductase [Aquitalea denitrificans]
MTLPDPIAQGVAAGWRVLDGAAQTQDLQLTCDVLIIGTGAGGGMTAEVLASAGLDVMMVEEGALRTSRDFRLLEAKAYPELYQEAASRKTADKAITILQGRTVGGSTTVNWTSAFRTPPDTLAWWGERYGLQGLNSQAMAPWFDMAEQRLGIADWLADPNPNNSVLERGCQALGLKHGRIRRNVRGCWNLGYCGMGCATNAKQSMLVTTIPGALEHKASLLSRARVERLLLAADGKSVQGATGRLLKADDHSPSARQFNIKARHVVLAAGAIGTPAILLRSGLGDAHVGKRTFLHPVSICGAVMPQRIEPYNGAPQTVYSDHFMHTQPLDGPLGYKLEVPPVHPLLMGVTLPGFGQHMATLMQQLPNLHVMLALLRDGFHPDSLGGQVRLRADGSPELDYPLNDVLWDGVRRSWLTMAELQFAAGARQVQVIHEQAALQSRWKAAREMIGQLALKPLLARLVSAHVMGGAAMSSRPEDGVVDEYGRHWALRNLSVIDGSVFPTSLGANPQLSIYAFALRAAHQLCAALKA